MLPHARSQTFGNACSRCYFDWQCTSFTKGNRRISFKKGSAKNYRFQKTQVPLPLVKDTGGMAKLSIACSIVFSDGCPRVATNNEKRNYSSKIAIDTTFLNVLHQSVFVIQKLHKRENQYVFPSVILNDVHAFFLLKNSTAPRGTPIPPLNDKKARKIKYEWSLFVVKSSDFIFRSRSFFSSSLNGGKGGACLRRFESDRVDVHEFRKSVHVHWELP